MESEKKKEVEEKKKVWADNYHQKLVAMQSKFTFPPPVALAIPEGVDPATPQMVDVTFSYKIETGHYIFQTPISLNVQLETRVEVTSKSLAAIRILILLNSMSTTADPAVFTIVAKNSKGVPLTHGGAPVKVEVTESDQDPCPVKLLTVPTPLTDPANPVSIESMSFFEPRNLSSTITSKTALTICPLFQELKPLLVYGPEEAYDTKPADIYIKARDRFGNDMRRVGDPFQVKDTLQ